jgi:predicted transcriptional regulator
VIWLSFDANERMTDSERAIETIEFVARSTNRVQLLETLYESSGATRSQLRDALPASRTTVTRNLDGLVEHGLVREVDGHYELTPGTDTVVDGFRSLAVDVETRSRLHPFLRWVDRDTFDVDLSALDDANVIVAEPGDPWAMVNAHVSRIRQSTDLTAAIPVTGLHAYEAVHETVVEQAGSVEVIATPDVVETFFEDPEYVQLTADLVDADRFDLYRTTADVPFYVGVLDDVVQVGVDEAGEPRALVESDDPAVRDWAQARLEVFERAGDLVDGDARLANTDR